MSDTLTDLKAVVAEAKTAVVHTPGLLERLVAAAEAHFKALETAVVADVEKVEAEVESVFEHKPAPVAETPAPVAPAAPAEPVADDEPAVVQNVANGAA
jgi:hypothetical protein